CCLSACLSWLSGVFFFFHAPATTQIYTLSLHDALPILLPEFLIGQFPSVGYFGGTSLLIVVSVTMDTVSQIQSHLLAHQYEGLIDRKSTRLNSSHVKISYAVFCLKKKTKDKKTTKTQTK